VKAKVPWHLRASTNGNEAGKMGMMAKEIYWRRRGSYQVFFFLKSLARDVCY
jgi:hypothetical protein